MTIDPLIAMRPVHPGEVLREEFMEPLGLTAGKIAKACGVPRTRIERVASEQTEMTADTALRLAKALGTTAQFWLNLQTTHNLARAHQSVDLSAVQVLHHAAE
ncbi:HigA family addiction module antitoxin [Nitrospirillum amazonense]|uniref:XRE family plasmid maintenance system antidote protein n=1 Tax=Nitrospirillum amazonense TaxID=28077 RepID=A0A560J347_9PROT|nr:HigA family addiction module antitoxin [Nitrospirillum amazonense]MDG3443558.1 HigA family addiction module antitoxin [Nitrospirillum amazonense]TWB65673.1 XRE family plasmid maintenance system antidote protein [Nitrospirillum amazonense]